MRKTQQTRLWAWVCRAALWVAPLLATAAVAQDSDYEPIRPMESRSSAIGLIDQAPLVSYNEYSGNVSVDLTVGVDGLSLPIHYSNQERSLQDVFPLPADHVLGGRRFGAGWYVGYGVISPSGHRPTHQQIYETDRPTEYDRVLYREPNGAESEFKVDLFFQQVPREDDWYNFHFVDAGLRRLERKIGSDSAVATNEFTMLGRDGTRTLFRSPVTSPNGMGYFYPIEIERPDGRKIALSYCDSSGSFPGTETKSSSLVCAGSSEMLLQSVSDDWGRSLRLHYVTRVATGATVIDHVTLETAGDSQLLASFRYEESWITGNAVTELRAHQTPLGHETIFHYERQFTTDAQQVNLSRVELPTGGEVELEYTRAEQYVCPNILWNSFDPMKIWATLRTRVSRLSYGGESYEFSYHQGHEYGHLYDGSWIVHMKTTQSPTPYERLTQYAQAKADLEGTPSGGAGYCRPDLKVSHRERIAGRPLRRLEAYGGPVDGAIYPVNGDFTFHPGGTHRREWWDHAVFSLKSPINQLPQPTSEILSWIPLVKSYQVKRDGRLWSTHFEYAVQGGGIFAAPAFDQPTRIVLSRNDVPGVARVQEFVYESRFTDGHGLEQTIAADPHVLALTTQAAEYFDEHGTTTQVRGESYDYQDGRHPRLLERAYQSSPNIEDAETTRFNYYETGPFRGLPASETRVGPNPFANQITHFDAYQYGQASYLRPPVGPAIERVLNADGTLAEESKDGVLTTYEYDADRRPRFTRFPGTGQYGKETIYSVPGQPSTRTELVGDRELMVESIDPWGRVTEKRTRLDDHTEAITRSEYDPLGLLAAEINAFGARRAYTYDVLGRQRSVRTHDAQGQLLEKVDLHFQALSGQIVPGGPERRTETMWRVGTSAFTQRISDSDFFGRTVRAALRTQDMPAERYAEHETHFEHTFADGLLRTLTWPGAGEPRLEERDWFGRLTLECHPEMYCTVDTANMAPAAASQAPVLHAYDRLGRRVRTTHTDGSSTVSYYDLMSRLTSQEEVSAAGQRVRTVLNEYNPLNNQLMAASSTAEGLDVKLTLGDFDALQRPLSTSFDIAQAHAAPYELSPSKYVRFGDELPLSWSEAVPVDRFEIVFERLGGAVPPLVFESIDAELLLDAAILEQAANELADAGDRQVWLGDLDADPDFLLDPEVDYRWRVYGWKGLEPTLASPWQVLSETVGPDDCHFSHFRVLDGINEGALVEWQSANCPEGGPLSVQILASTLDVTPACGFEDALFAADKLGPKRALFMVTGYDMVDGEPDFPEDLNQPDCPGVGEASFRGVVTDPDGETIHEIGPEIGRVVIGDICDVRNVNIIDGLNGSAPVVRWESSDCTDEIVEVLAEAEVDPLSPNAEQCRFPGVLATGFAGQVGADFMVDGYSVDGQACAPVGRAWFWVRISDPNSGVVFETSPLLGYVEPVGGFPSGCYTRLFTESSAPGIVPIVAWEARNCDGYDVELTRTAVGIPSDLNCLIRNDLWQTDPFGVRDTRFMIDGYTGLGGAICDPVADMLAAGENRVEFDFSINIRDPQTNLLIEPQTAIKKTLRATYTLPPAGSSSGPCRIDYFGVTNGFFGHQPLATWGTSGDCLNVELKVSTDPYLDPAHCRLYDTLWSSLPDGPVHLGFMVGGYDEGLVDDGDDTLDCVGELGGNGTHGEALTKAFVSLVATASDGTEIREPSGEGLLVRNHNDQNQSTLPGPDDPCEIIDFGVDQPALPGRQATDSLPTIRWSTNCAASSRYSVRVYATAESLDDHPLCRLDDLLFGSSKNGPQPAVFLRTGWWDWFSGGHRCFTRHATFRMEIVEDATGIQLPGQSAGPLEVSFSGAFEGDPPIGPCEGDSCVQSCELPIPDFGGLTSDPSAGTDCQASLSWLPGTSHCGGGLTYNIYRHSTPVVMQDEAHLLAEGVNGTSYIDTGILAGGSYYYMVTAKDTISGVESAPAEVRRLVNQCSQGQSPFWSQPSVVQAGQSTTLHWDFPGATYLFLVGYGEQPSQGQLTVTPSDTTRYQLLVTFGSGSGSFTAEVEVQGSNSPPPVAGGACSRPCAESTIIDGEEHFCRGFGAWDGDYEVTQDPVWLSVADWEDYVRTPLGDPISPYCLKAVCGDGSFALNAWHPPEGHPTGWISDSALLDAVEFPGDGLDNDCDVLIDE
ncbi:MAG: hypothetical protein MPN21_26495 [Thermoanaerobaculia bacterium]|nr:hypothetical protein [Thermoanaerobaculia bacterium]